MAELIFNTRKSHQVEARVIMSASIGIAGLAAAALAGYSTLVIVLATAAAVTGNYIAIPTLTDKVGSNLYFNKMDMEKLRVHSLKTKKAVSR